VGYPHNYHYLDSGASFRGMRLPAQAAGRSAGPVMADAWVRVVPSDQVASGQQADRLVAGAAVLCGRYSNGKVWAISAKNSATGTEMFGGTIDESLNTIKDPQWGTQYSLDTGDVVGKWCPSPPIIGGIIGTIFPVQGVWVPKVREQGGFIEVQVDVNAKAEFEKKYWKGVLDAQGKADGGYYWVPGRREALATGAAGVVAGVGLLGGAGEANAEVEYPNVKYLGGDTNNLDVNNANIRVYTKLPGLYPNVAKKLIASAPYKGLDDMYGRAGFTEAETAAVKKYEKQLLFLEPKPEYVIDNINNGLYK